MNATNIFPKEDASALLRQAMKGHAEPGLVRNGGEQQWRTRFVVVRSVVLRVHGTGAHSRVRITAGFACADTANGEDGLLSV
jgi:hypothetical protein